VGALPTGLNHRVWCADIRAFVDRLLAAHPTHFCPEPGARGDGKPQDIVDRCAYLVLYLIVPPAFSHTIMKCHFFRQGGILEHAEHAAGRELKANWDLRSA
jgi:hypothetical protein